MEICPTHFVAHRGYQKHFPENSLCGIEAAIHAGAQFIELDIQFSKDCVPFLYHDDSLQKCSCQPGKIFDYQAAEIVQFPYHEPQRFGEKFAHETIRPLSALKPYMLDNPHITYYLELKEESIKYLGAQTCLKSFQTVLSDTIQQCCLISFDCDALLLAKEMGFRRVGPVLRQWESQQEIIDELHAEVTFVNKKRLPKGQAIEAHSPVVVYEIADYPEAKSLLQQGASKIETFAIGEMLQCIDQESVNRC